MSQTDIPSGNNYVTFVIAWWKWRETNISVPVKEIIKRTITFRVIRFRGTKTITDGDKGFPDLQLDIQPRQIFPVLSLASSNGRTITSLFHIVSWIGWLLDFVSFFLSFSNLFSSEMFLEIQSSWNKYHHLRMPKVPRVGSMPFL